MPKARVVQTVLTDVGAESPALHRYVVRVTTGTSTLWIQLLGSEMETLREVTVTVTTTSQCLANLVCGSPVNGLADWSRSVGANVAVIEEDETVIFNTGADEDGNVVVTPPTTLTRTTWKGTSPYYSIGRVS